MKTDYLNHICVMKWRRINSWGPEYHFTYMFSLIQFWWNTHNSIQGLYSRHDSTAVVNDAKLCDVQSAIKSLVECVIQGQNISRNDLQRFWYTVYSLRNNPTLIPESPILTINVILTHKSCPIARYFLPFSWWNFAKASASFNPWNVPLVYFVS